MAERDWEEEVRTLGRLLLSFVEEIVREQVRGDCAREHGPDALADPVVIYDLAIQRNLRTADAFAKLAERNPEAQSLGTIARVCQKVASTMEQAKGNGEGPPPKPIEALEYLFRDDEEMGV